nr:acetoin utilization protein AcuC [Paenibacillus turpanensis]
MKYFFGDTHPFNQKRLDLTISLLRAANALDVDDPTFHIPPAVDDELLASVHTQEYLSFVKALSEQTPDPTLLSQAGKYGLDDGDTPHFPGMHDVTRQVVGGSVSAVEAVMSGRTCHALHLGGGLHHAMANRAGGFCIYNDASVAISYARSRYKAKVLYVDTDVHHGDGVQMSFYTDPSVCTFSIHETGKYLFPGTGYAHERGEGEGFGTCFNMPVEPYTEDESWLECFTDMLFRIVDVFQPDLIISQHGCDAHAWDPLAHVHCSMDIYLQMPLLLQQAAERCSGRWVALGGGGYDIWRVVPRAWGLLWLVMSGHPLVGELLQHGNAPLPEAWLERWSPYSPSRLPTAWLDDKDALGSIPRREEIAIKNRQTKQLAMQFIE